MVKCAITMLLVHSIMKKVSVYLTLFIYCSLTAQNINNISYELMKFHFLYFPPLFSFPVSSSWIVEPDAKSFIDWVVAHRTTFCIKSNKSFLSELSRPSKQQRTQRDVMQDLGFPVMFFLDNGTCTNKLHLVCTILYY